MLTFTTVKFERRKWPGPKGGRAAGGRMVGPGLNLKVGADWLGPASALLRCAEESAAALLQF